VIERYKGRRTSADPTGRCVDPTQRPVRSAPALHGPTRRPSGRHISANRHPSAVTDWRVTLTARHVGSCGAALTNAKLAHIFQSCHINEEASDVIYYQSVNQSINL